MSIRTFLPVITLSLLVPSSREANADELLVQLGYLGYFGYMDPPSLTGDRDDQIAYFDDLEGLGYVSALDLSTSEPFAPFGYGYNSGYYLTVDFEVCGDEEGTWDFRVGGDFGWGVEMYLDAALVDADYGDHWWGYDWNYAGILTASEALEAGDHTLEVVGYETCCGGDSVLQRRMPGGDWEAFVAGDRDCPVDTDGDGLYDEDDACPNTAPGEIINASGCSVNDLNPCDGDWKNHGAYVSSVVKTAQAFRAAGLLTNAQYADLVSTAAKSDCGR